MSEPRPDFSGRTAAVTGAASGIGRAVTLKLSQAGARVFAIDVSERGLKETCSLARHQDVTPVLQDVSATRDLPALFASIAARAGALEHLVTAAGINRVESFLDVTPDSWARMFSINLEGTFFSIQAAARHLAASGRGSVVALASLAGRLGRPQYPHYAASKAGVISVCRSAALALAPKVRVNCVCPGVIETPMWAQLDQENVNAFGREPGEAFASAYGQSASGRAGSAAEVADVILFLLSDDAAYVNGQAVQVDGGTFMV